MNKTKISNEDIENFFKILKSLKNKKKRLSLHEPFFDIKDLNAVKNSLKTSEVSTYGKYTKIFENKLKEFCNSKYCFSTINGSSALQVSLILSGVNENTEVILSTLGFVSSLNSISHLNAQPIFCDCEKETLGMDPIKLKNFLKKNCIIKNDKCFNKQTKKYIGAAIITHVFGNPCQVLKLRKVLKSYKIKIIEDAAECIGSRYKKKHLGTFGDYGILSFNGNKIITSGGGGAVLLKKLDDYKKGLNLVRNMKISHPYEQKFSDVGFNYRLPSINSSLGISQLSKIGILLRNKKNLRKFYEKKIKNFKILRFFISLNSSQSNNWLNAVLIDSNYINLRDNILQRSLKNNIELRPVWSLLHKMKKFKNCQKTDLANAIDLEKRLITLPSSYNLIRAK
ncbi:DegT/DnrJ/EryC1/StrS family aminotransferase [Candidatus Pelagibacter sp.]|nr:DegT/DnrJ/EryC1/StrS family aminotransferase [Candidatus Pelagibacter sp.]